MRNVSNYIIQIHFLVLHVWSRLGELPSSDEMKMFYTEHDFQVDLEISCRDNTTLLFVDLNRDSSGDHVKILYAKIIL